MNKQEIKSSLPKIITAEFLDENPNYIFVFGDNLLRKGKKGAAILRDHPQAYGFITKKIPNNYNSSFYKPHEYQEIFQIEYLKLVNKIKRNPDKVFLISKLGSGLANKYHIFEKVIEKSIKKLEFKFSNVICLF